jgi:hypothetical protein
MFEKRCFTQMSFANGLERALRSCTRFSLWRSQQHNIVWFWCRPYFYRCSEAFLTNAAWSSTAGCDGQWKGSYSNQKRSEFEVPKVSGDWAAPFSRWDCDGIRAKLALPRATTTMLERNCWAYGVSHFDHFRLSHGPGRDEALEIPTTASGEEDGIGT